MMQLCFSLKSSVMKPTIVIVNTLHETQVLHKLIPLPLYRTLFLPSCEYDREKMELENRSEAYIVLHRKTAVKLEK